MIVFRLSKSNYSKDLTGKGAELSGGRWNSKEMPLIYTSESRALCTAEIAVHIPLGMIPSDYELVTIEIPDKIKVFELNKSDLPDDWKTFPHSNSTQIAGDQFAKEFKYLVMKVPSVDVTGDFNYLINPKHDDINQIKITSTEPFEFDKRIFTR